MLLCIDLFLYKSDFKICAIIVIFSQEINTFFLMFNKTNNHNSVIVMVKQQTYSMIKPNAFAKKDEILLMIKSANYTVLAQKEIRFTKSFAEQFYIEHKAKSFFGELVQFMISGPVYALILEKENAVSEFRTFIGSTDPKKAAPGTIRALYGTSINNNAIHASDSAESATRELKLIFG